MKKWNGAICAVAVATAMGSVFAGGVGAAATGQPPQPPSGAASLEVAGSQLFKLHCAECHTVTKDGDQFNGPNLAGVVGAKVGMKPDFPYSEALKGSGITWTEESLDKWLAGPSTLVPDNMMGFVGMPKAEDRKALIAFLAERTAE